MLVIQVLKDQTAPVSALLAVFIDKYGTTALEWEPELIRKQIEEDYDIELSDLQADKLHAGIALLTSDCFENDWQAFETIGHLLNNTPDDFDTLNPLDAEEIAAAIGEATLIKHESLEFGESVNAYAGLVFKDYGFSKPPEIMQSAIIPASVESDDGEKNDAMMEILEDKVDRVVAYVSDLFKD